MERAKIDEGLEKYVKYSVEELVVLKESYKARITSKTRNHWISKLQRNYNRDIKTTLVKLSRFLMLLGMFPMILLVIIMIFNPILGRVITLEYTNFLLGPIFIFTMTGTFLLTAIDDKTAPLRKELRNIELILEKKYSPDKKIMLDSNIINDVQSGKIARKDIENAKARGFKFYITHIQIDEISDVNNPDLRQQLFAFMALLTPEIVNTHSSVEGLSRFGFTDIKNGEIILKMTEDKSNPKKFKDALIAETSIEREFTLLTNDDKLRADVLRYKGRTITLAEFKNILSN